MKKFLKIFTITCITSILFMAFFVLVSGFRKISDAYIGEYVVSEDGNEITVQTGVAGSVGAVRMLLPYKENEILYLDAYAAFGGINGYLGAKNEESFLLSEDTTVIALYRSSNRYEVILEKDEAGIWKRVPLGTFIERK